MKDWKSVRPICEFGHQVVIGAFEPSLEGSFPTVTYFGLVQDATYIYGSFRDADGHLYTPMRHVQPNFSLPSVLQTTLDGGDLLPHPKGIGFTGQVNQRIDGNVHIAESSPRGKAFSVRRRLDGVTWIEGDVISVEGRRIGPGMQWYDPGRAYGGLYLSHIHHAKGTILGKEVEGFFGWDQLYTPAGHCWHKSPYIEGLEVAWHTPANLYDDGTFEVGQICYGQENYNYAMICNEQGPVIMTTDVSAEIEFNERGFPEKVHYLIDGEAWDWVGAENGEMPFYAKRPPIYRPREGVCTRVGETRKVLCSFGWIDTFNDGRHKAG